MKNWKWISLVMMVFVIVSVLFVACGDDNDDDDSSDDDDDDNDQTGQYAYSIVDTNQSQCYDVGNSISCPSAGSAFYGQDAVYNGYQINYQDNGDGTVTDLITGLMWQQDPGDKMQYAEAIAGADGFSLAGYDDWRVPTIKELYSLILFSGQDPSGGNRRRHLRLDAVHR